MRDHSERTTEVEHQGLKEKAKEIRKRLLQMIHEGKTGHTGGALSSVDILVSLYYAVMNIDRMTQNAQREIGLF